MRLTFVLWPSVRRYCTASRTEPRLGSEPNAAAKPQLSDEQWAVIEDLFPWDPPDSAGGRPRVPPRPCLEGILWVLRTGARWKDLPKSFPSYPTCWRRLQEWSDDGTFEKAWARSLKKLDGLGQVNWKETFADGTFCSAKKGVAA
jgi:transposase